MKIKFKPLDNSDEVGAKLLNIKDGRATIIVDGYEGSSSIPGNSITELSIESMDCEKLKQDLVNLENDHKEKINKRNQANRKKDNEVVELKGVVKYLENKNYGLQKLLNEKG